MRFQLPVPTTMVKCPATMAGCHSAPALGHTRTCQFGHLYRHTDAATVAGMPDRLGGIRMAIQVAELALALV